MNNQILATVELLIFEDNIIVNTKNYVDDKDIITTVPLTLEKAIEFRYKLDKIIAELHERHWLDQIKSGYSIFDIDGIKTD